ncbi:MAG: ABC transporter ATP-binding protein [Kiloniellales bacterium]
MSLSDRIYRPFERLIQPLDLPVRPLPSKGSVRLIGHFAWIFRWPLILVALAAAATSAMGLIVVWAVAFVVDGVVADGAAVFVQSHWLLIAAITVLLVIVDPLVRFTLDALMNQPVSVGLPAALRWQAHKAVEDQDVGFFDDLFAGQVASRIDQVTSSVRHSLLYAAEYGPYFAVQFFGAVVLLAALSWPLAIPVAVWIATNTLLAWCVMPIYVRLSEGVAEVQSRATGAMTDVYGNIRMVKLFAAEDSEAGVIRDVIAESVDTEHRQRRAFVGTETAIHLLNAVLTVSIFAVGIWGLIAGFVTVGTFAAAAAVVRILSNSATAFIGLGQGISEALGTIRDAMPVLTTPPTITDQPDAKPLALTEGAIIFDRVRFGYKQGKTVIDDLSLAIEPGEKVGLVGLSGAGKSTLVNLLLRLYDVEGGVVRIDGQDVRHVTQESLRAQIGVITQDVALLNRSVFENIRYGSPDAPLEDVITAARMAEAHTFIADLRDGEGRRGYDAHVGERGIKLSGGQRQRIAIARVMLKNAPILVLDEATSSLDSEAEATIQAELADLMAGKTVLAIAHRLSTIAALDRIVVMRDGQVMESGTPDDLLKRDGLYARLWKRQTGGYIAA